MKVFLLEGEPEVRSTLANLLTRAGLEVAVTGSLAEAHDVVQGAGADVLLVDLDVLHHSSALDVYDPQSVLLDLRRRSGARRMVFIGSSRRTVQDQEWTLPRLGDFPEGTEFLPKPIDLQRLLKILGARDDLRGHQQVAAPWPDERRERQLVAELKHERQRKEQYLSTATDRSAYEELRRSIEQLDQDIAAIAALHRISR